MSPDTGTLLSKINSPFDLKRLQEEDLPRVCEEIRQFIIDVISVNPGHLAASLGTVELAVAIHYVFDTPSDKLIWDVGHQAYAHKILTGRKDRFFTLRKQNGISGFPKMTESEYDAFGTGHSSTSISAALGMAIASSIIDQNGKNHIAVIGDGSMTGGMAMEALNNAGVSKANLLVILNDNNIAIDKNVGAIKEYLLDITTSRSYNKFKDIVWKIMGGNTKYGVNSRAIFKQVGNAVKSTILKKSNLFEAFGFRYFGPTDGHDVVHLVKILRDLKQLPGPKILHAITVKGKGLSKAEKEPTTYHSPGLFDKNTGEIKNSDCTEKLSPKFQHVFGKTIIELAEKNRRIVGITPAMATGSSLNMMMQVMPDRAFDVGIAEQHAVTFAAGLATQGMIPYCNIYSTFMQRAYDQVIHDVALQKLHVVFCLDRSGIVGEDGDTHHGAYDLAYLRTIPDITIAAPMNEEELRNLMYTAQFANPGTFAIRYPRGRGFLTEWRNPFHKLEIGKGRQLVDGNDIAIVSIGITSNFAVEAAGILQQEGISTAVFDMRFLKPIDQEILHRLFRKFNKIITIEDGTIVGGFGSAVIEFMADHNYSATVKRLGIPDQFAGQGTPEELYKKLGYDTDGIVKTAHALLNS